MKLSEAIRLGAMLKPQGFGNEALFGKSTCALGAAADAVNLPEELERYETLCTPFPIVGDHVEACPAGAGCAAIWCGVTVLHMAYHLNDIHKWTRERIADWVATIEPQEVEADICATVETVSVLE